MFAENNLSSHPAQRWLNPGYSDLDHEDLCLRCHVVARKLFECHSMCPLKWWWVIGNQTQQCREPSIIFRGLSESIIYIYRGFPIAMFDCIDAMFWGWNHIFIHIWDGKMVVLNMIPRDQFFTMGPWPHKLGFFGSPLGLHPKADHPIVEMSCYLRDANFKV